MLKKLLFILLGILFLGSAVDAALDYIYFAGPGKKKAVEILSSHLQTKVEIEKLKFRILTGFSARNVVVYHPENETPFLTVGKLECHPSYLALLKKQLIIKKLYIRRPVLKLEKSERSRFSLPDKKFSLSKNPFFIQKLKIRGGRITISDPAAREDTLNYRIDQIHMKGTLNNEGLLDASLKFSIGPEKVFTESNTVKAQALYNLNSHNFSAEGITKNFPVRLFKPYLSRYAVDLKDFSGHLNTAFEMSGTLNKDILVHAEVFDSDMNIAFTPWQYNGKVSLKAKARYHFNKNKWTYLGKASLQETTFNTSLLPSPITNLNGNFIFKNDHLSSDGVEGLFQGHSLRAKGWFQNVNDPRFEAFFFTDLPPEKILDITQRIRPGFLAPLSIQGKSFLRLSALKNEEHEKTKWNGDLFLKDALVKSNQFLLSYERLSGRISFTHENIVLNNLKGNLIFDQINRFEAPVEMNGNWSFKKNPQQDALKIITLSVNNGKLFSPWLKETPGDIRTTIEMTPSQIVCDSFNGIAAGIPFKGGFKLGIKNKKATHLDFSLSADGYSLLLQGNKTAGNFKLHKCSGYAFGTTFDIIGEIPFSGKDKVKLQIESKIDTVALKKAWPVLWEKYSWLSKWNPEGPFEVSGVFKGKFSSRKTWEADARVKGRRVTLKNAYFDSLDFKYNLNKLIVSYEDIILRSGDGTLTGMIVTDFAASPYSTTLNLEANNLEIKNILTIMNLPVKNEESLEGKTSGYCVLKGHFKQPDTLYGEGAFDISDGRLWDTPILKPIWITIRNFAPNLQKPVFKSSKADFVIDRGWIQTENLEVAGTGLILKAMGKVSLKKQIDMLIKIKFIEPEGSAIKMIAAKGINLFGKLLEIEYKGTLSHPQVKRRWLPMINKFVSSD